MVMLHRTLLNAGAIFLLASALVFAQEKEYPAKQDTSRQVIINNYYYGGYPYYPPPVYFPSYGPPYFHVSIFVPFHRRIVVHHPFRHRFAPRPFGYMRSGGRRY
jgi:hypothetical protein